MEKMQSQIQNYAELIVRQGVNLRPGQCLIIRAEIGLRDFVRRVVAAAYAAGARFVEVEWIDPLLMQARLDNSRPEDLDFLPDSVTVHAEERMAEGWVSMSIVGKEFPELLAGADSKAMRRILTAYYAATEKWRGALMRNQIAWTVCAAPTPAWACQVFPHLGEEEAVQSLWSAILASARVTPDGDGQAWAAHTEKLMQVADFLNSRTIDSLHFYDPAPGPDGKASTDLTIGLTDRPKWISGTSHTSDGRAFSPNIPTEEAFVTPNRHKAQGWTRSSKPFFPFEQEVSGAWFCFEEGAVVDYGAEKGAAVLEQYFQVDGTRRLGEVALVDAGSPIFQSGLLFYNTLFDENAAIHLALGRGYAIGIEGGSTMSAEELDTLGLNHSTLHLDTMIGTETMQVTAHYRDGDQIQIMHNGRYTEEVLAVQAV